MINQLTFGTMRLAALKHSAVVDLLSEALEQGVRRFHSSNEYDSFDLFCKALADSCEECQIDTNSIEHIVKIAAPHFDNDTFYRNELIQKCNSYKEALDCDTLFLVQWMTRIDLANEPARLNVLKVSNDEISDSVSELKSSGTISKFGCFPYSDSFRKEVLRKEWCDVLVDYYNPLESSAKSEFHAMREDQSLFAIRPLFPLFANDSNGKIHQSEKWDVAALLQFALETQKIESLIISMSSAEHLREIIENIDRINNQKLSRGSDK
jgi:aryl-alcohol dehydrogenase-like predicted oxidoreductase